MELCAVKLCAVLIVSWVFAMHVEAVEFCGVPLGMEDGRIPDSSITASSTFTPTTCLTRNARLNNPGSPWTESGWCPSNSDRTNPWLQVDLQRPTKIEGVIMQGVVGGLGVTAYQVQYSNNQTGWRYVGQNEMGSGIVETFRTNVGSSGPPVTHLFPSPVKARYIRIRPTEYNLLPAIRMELIGCQVLDCPSNITQFAEISSTAVPVSWEEPPTADSLPWNATHRPGDLFPVGSVTEVAYTAQNDGEGSFISCSFTVAVTGVDITCPGNVSVSTNVNNFANVSWPLPRLRFSGVNPDVRVISNYEPGQGFTIGTTLVTYRIPETKAECQFYVSVLDNQPPVIRDCPDDVIVPVNSSSGQLSVSWSPPSISDNSGRDIQLTFKCRATTPTECNEAGEGTFSVGITTVIYKAQDQSGIESVCQFTVNVTVVNLACPQNVTVTPNPGSSRASVSWPEPILTGWDGPTNVASNFNPGDMFSIGAEKVVYRHRFEAFSFECSFFVQVLDNEPPEINGCPDDVIIPVGSSSSRVPHVWTPPLITDQGEVNVSFSCQALAPTECYQAGDGILSEGITIVMYKAQDQSGNENVCRFVIEITVVNLVCPANVTAFANPGSTRTSVNWMEPDLTGWNRPTNLTSSANPGAVFMIGTHRVSYQQWFGEYNLRLGCSFFIVVVDNQPPVITSCPNDIIVPVNSSSSQQSVSWFPPSISDNSGRDIEVTLDCLATAPTECNEAGEGTFSVGNTTVIYKAQDRSGNENVCRFVIEITVVNLVCPSNVTAFSNPGSTRTSVNWMEPDLIGWNRPTNLTSSANPGAVFMIGTHRVSYQQWFGEYNLHLGCSFFIVVVDNQPPVITSCPNDIIVPVNSSSSQQSVSWFPPSISDNSGRDIEVTLDCLATAPTECNEAGEGTFSVGNTTVIYKAQDQSGTESICQFTVIVKVANFVCPPNVTVTLNPWSSRTSASWPQPVLAGWDGPTNVTSNFKPGDMFTIGTEKVDYRSSFELYNFQCSFFVHVLDIEPPEIISCPDDVIIPVGSSSSWVPHVWTPPLITDQGEVNVSFICQALAPTECNQAGSGTFSEGVNTVMYKAQDQSGNENVCRFVIQVTVVDLVCPENMTALANPGSKRSSVNWMEPDLTGWNGPTNLTSSANPGSVFMIGTHRVSYQQWFAAYELGLDCSFSVMVVGRCPSNSTSDGLRWPAVTAGSTAKSVQRCALTTAKAGQPLAVRNCSIENPPIFFQWEEPEPRSCGEAKNEVSLDNVARVEVSEGNVVEVAEFLANQTSESTEDAENVGAVSAILVNVVSTRSGNKEVAELVVQTVSNVIKSTETTADSKTPDINAGNSSAIIRSVEAQVSLTLRKEGKVSIRQDKVHVEAVSLDPEKASGGFSFVSARQAGQELPRDGSLGGAEVNTFFDTKDIPADIEVVASVRLPGNIADSIYPSDGNNSVQLQASFLIYADDTLFQSASLRKYRGENNSTRKVAGSVVSLTVENVELVNLTEPLVIEFKTPNNVTDEELQTIQCVSWDFNLEDGVGDWSPAGCERAGLTADKMSCDCYHATNFAVLLDVKGQVPEDTPEKKALDVISQVGCALSIVALAVTLIIYLSIRKLRSGISRQIFIHFCFSLLMLYIVFLAGIDNAKGSGGGCVFVAALLHYLTLSTMMWMAVEARNMYISTVKVFPEDRPRYMLKACLIAWGSSLIVLTITLAAGTNHYKNDHYCFLRPGLVLYIGLLTPIGLILIHNIITFVLVMRSLLKVKEVSRSQQISKRLQNAVGISALMGLTWCFGFLAIEGATFIFQLIFCLANSLQGVVVFIMFCARREEVRLALTPYVRRICCGRECRLPALHPVKSKDVEMISTTAPTVHSTGQTGQFDLSISIPNAPFESDS